MAVRQLQGLWHCKLMKRRAKRIWRNMDPKWKEGAWDACLKQAIEEHRLKCEAEAVARRVQYQLALSSVIFTLGEGDY